MRLCWVALGQGQLAAEKSSVMLVMTWAMAASALRLVLLQMPLAAHVACTQHNPNTGEQYHHWVLMPCVVIWLTIIGPMLLPDQAGISLRLPGMLFHPGLATGKWCLPSWWRVSSVLHE